ncbi:MAG: class I SAM-dependent methyltransferase [Pseudomonadota bacterium]|nr:class I SAM-dependent methyltransferase [Pseudomonadota bacterium]
MRSLAVASRGAANSGASLAGKNRALYGRPAVTTVFARAAEQYPAERVILERYRDAYAGRHVLDLGVGVVRTTPWLAPHAASYVGIDYSPEMVRAAQVRFPEWDFRSGDAGVLAGFGAASLDFVLFALNRHRLGRS